MFFVDAQQYSKKCLLREGRSCSAFGHPHKSHQMDGPQAIYDKELWMKVLKVTK